MNTCRSLQPRNVPFRCIVSRNSCTSVISDRRNKSHGSFIHDSRKPEAAESPNASAVAGPKTWQRDGSLRSTLVTREETYRLTLEVCQRGAGLQKLSPEKQRPVGSTVLLALLQPH